MMLQEIFTGVLLFTVMVMILAALILLVRSLLVPRENVTVKVNDNLSWDVPVGSQLLHALADKQLYLPSACGGGGSCGQCKVMVLSGGGSILPTETTHISRREAADGQRLACQLSIDNNIHIKLPETITGVKKVTCQVRSNLNVATFIKELVLELPEDEVLNFHAGGYVMIECPKHHMLYTDIELPEKHQNEWQRLGLLTMESSVKNPTERAYSLANYPGECNRIILNVRIATPPPSMPIGTPPGQVSSYIFSLKPGDPVTIKGPFGEFFAKQTDAEMIFIGGGAGMAPMRSHILDQLKRIKTQRTISFWYGARSLREAFYLDTFNQLAESHDNFSWHLALSEPLSEDQWTGHTGFIHDVLYARYLANHPAPEDCEYYLCGPPMMIAALAHMLDDLGVDEEQIMFDDFGG